MEAKRRQAKPEFVSRSEVLSMLPDVSGNDINGLGESAQRRATPVMWHDPDIIAHGKLQTWYRNQGSSPGARHYRLQYLSLTQ